MIHTLPTLVDEETYHGEEVTVRCTVLQGPRTGSRGGTKTLYDVDISGCTFDGPAFLSIWHENPSWTDGFGATPEYIRELLTDVPLQHGETVLARGVPNTHNNKWYFNVTSVLLRDPDTTIGKSEMRSARECPRIYDLAFNKKVYSPGRFDFSPGSVKGRIVHSFLEHAVNDAEYRENFRNGWSEPAMEECFEEILDKEYAIDLALCRLAWISPNRIKEHAWDAIEPLVTDEEFTHIIAEADSVSAEVALSSSVGFNGRVDLVIDGTPYDLKTSYRPSDAHRKKHRFQLRIYLLAFVLESLEPGETLSERIEGGVEGAIVYPNLSGKEGVELEWVELRKQDLRAIMEMRNEAAVLREGFGVPTTYGRDCAGCGFKEPTVVGGGDTDDESLPPPCQFYCQSERRWACFETDDNGQVITQCPLFDECEQRLDFRNPAVTDHYNRLRTALDKEREARHNLGVELDHLNRDTLIHAGLLLPGLTLQSVEGQRRLVFAPERPVAPSFSPGDKVRLYHADSEYYQTATYYGHDGNSVVFELDGQPTLSFLDPTTPFEAKRTVSTETHPRELLGQLDYAQRAEVAPLIESTGAARDVLVELAPERLDEVTDYLDNKEIYINVPVRRDRSDVVAELVDHFSTASFPKPEGGDSIPEADQRILVLSSMPAVTDAIAAQIGEQPGVVRMNGFAGAGSETVTPAMGGHEIYTALDSSRLVLSSTRYALAENVFHAMQSGDREARPHSDRFFDVVVLVGAEQLTEPQFHFLRVLGDRVIAMGDIHRSGPEMVSGEARNARLDEAYFNRLYRRFANVENPDSQCLSLPAELTEPVADVLSNLDVPTDTIDGSIGFVDAEGSSATAIAETNLEYSIPLEEGESGARFLRLEPVEAVDASQISQALTNLRALDAGALTIQNEYTIQGIRFAVLTNNPIDDEHHQVEVNVPIHSTPFLNQLLTHNPGEVTAVVQTCQEREPDVVVTPFVAHANTIREALTEADLDVPVYLPQDLTGDHYETAVISFGVSDSRRLVSPSVNEIEVLYTLLNAAETCILVGDRGTLERNSVLKSALTYSSE